MKSMNFIRALNFIKLTKSNQSRRKDVIFGHDFLENGQNTPIENENERKWQIAKFHLKNIEKTTDSNDAYTIEK